MFQRVDGNWGEWDSWSECSSSCHLGIAGAERRCDHPHPSNGGRYCGGKSKRFVLFLQDAPDIDW